MLGNRSQELGGVVYGSESEPAEILHPKVAVTTSIIDADATEFKGSSTSRTILHFCSNAL